jgi:hypothetical protein
MNRAAEPDASTHFSGFDTYYYHLIRLLAQQSCSGEQFEGIAFVSRTRTVDAQLLNLLATEHVHRARRRSQTNRVQNQSELTSGQNAEQGHALRSAVDALHHLCREPGPYTLKQAQSNRVILEQEIAQSQYQDWRCVR